VGSIDCGALERSAHGRLFILEGSHEIRLW